MKPEQQRIAIAEACGWRIESDGANTFVYSPNKTSGTGYRMNDIRHPKIIKLLPDYLNDLNAMHEAEKALDPIRQCRYAETLYRLMIGNHAVSGFMKIHAAAALRAEAFLKTLNLWKP
jgi:hypothetical protein